MSWIGRLLHRSRLESQLDAELGFHIDQLAQDLERQGLSPQEARRQARLRFGGGAQITEECRDARGTARIESLIQDLKHALRILAKSPAVTVPGIVALALAIGANTVIFSAVYALLLKPLPYPDERNLFMIFSKVAGEDRIPFSTREFEAWRAGAHAFSHFGAHTGNGFTMKGRGEPVALFGVMATPGLFDALGVSAAHGRILHDSDARPGREHVVVLSDGLWREKFDADPNAVGESVYLNGESYTVVGVMPADFSFPASRYQLWVPAALESGVFQKFPDAHLLRTVGRLRPGVSVAQLAAETDVLGKQVSELDRNSRRTMFVVSLPESVRGPLRRPLMALLAAVLFILLIACANVASILLARGTGRSVEFAVRAALGAGRFRIIQQLVVESTLLAAFGGAGGVALAVIGVRALRRFSDASLPGAETIHLNASVLLFGIGLSLATGILFGVTPAILAARRAMQEGLRQGTRGTADQGSSRAYRAIVAVEAALSVMLVVGAGLFAHSFVRLSSTNPGFRPDHVLTASITLDEKTYPDATNMLRYVRVALEQARSIPGVDAAAVATHMPFSGQGWGNGYEVEGRPAEPGKAYVAQIRPISPDYFRVMGIPLRQGEPFKDDDTAGAPFVAIINDSLARRFWAGESPVGKRLRFDQDWLTIRGVVGDIKHARLDADTDPEIYVPYEQLPPNLVKFLGRGLTVAVHGSLDPASMASALRAALRSADPGLAVRDVKPLDRMVAASFAPSRFRTALLTAFSGIALVLAGIGIYGIMAYLVAERMREIGVRVALGAQRSAIVQMIVGRTLMIAGVGVAIGLLAAAALVRTVRTLLFGIAEYDPLAFIAGPAVILLVAAVASTVPAMRAARADPLTSLRAE
jgi:putative ABC transport system permease protein